MPRASLWPASPLASRATRGEILRYVFSHIALATLVGVLVFLQAYVFP